MRDWKHAQIFAIVAAAAINGYASQDGRPPIPPGLAASAAVEQTAQGSRPPLPVIESFDGLGFGFAAALGVPNPVNPRNPSDNSLAVGPNHVFQIVNSQLAIFTKKGSVYQTTGKVLYGPIATNTLLQASAASVDRDRMVTRWCATTNWPGAGLS
jgi:hypothetical protein